MCNDNSFGEMCMVRCFQNYVMGTTGVPMKRVLCRLRIKLHFIRFGLTRPHIGLNYAAYIILYIIATYNYIHTVLVLVYITY